MGNTLTGLLKSEITSHHQSYDVTTSSSFHNSSQNNGFVPVKKAQKSFSEGYIATLAEVKAKRNNSSRDKNFILERQSTGPKAYSCDFLEENEVRKRKEERLLELDLLQQKKDRFVVTEGLTKTMVEKAIHQRNTGPSDEYFSFDHLQKKFQRMQMDKKETQGMTYDSAKILSKQQKRWNQTGNRSINIPKNMSCHPNSLQQESESEWNSLLSGMADKNHNQRPQANLKQQHRLQKQDHKSTNNSLFQKKYKRLPNIQPSVQDPSKENYGLFSVRDNGATIILNYHNLYPLLDIGTDSKCYKLVGQNFINAVKQKGLLDFTFSSNYAILPPLPTKQKALVSSNYSNASLKVKDSETRRCPDIYINYLGQSCQHTVLTTACRICERPPSRGGRDLMHWLNKKKRLRLRKKLMKKFKEEEEEDKL